MPVITLEFKSFASNYVRNLKVLPVITLGI